MFKRQQPAPRVFPQKPSGTGVATKEQKWGKHCEAVLARLSVIVQEGWIMVYTEINRNSQNARNSVKLFTCKYIVLT